jgi:hypothetical protein
MKNAKNAGGRNLADQRNRISATWAESESNETAD